MFALTPSGPPLPMRWRRKGRRPKAFALQTLFRVGSGLGWRTETLFSDDRRPSQLLDIAPPAPKLGEGPGGEGGSPGPFSKNSPS